MTIRSNDGKIVTKIIVAILLVAFFGVIITLGNLWVFSSSDSRTIAGILFFILIMLCVAFYFVGPKAKRRTKNG
jgi:type VI protein secretion system component VasK